MQVVEAQCISEFRHGRASAGETAGVLSCGWLLEKQLRNEMVQSWKEVEERFAKLSTFVLAAWTQHWEMYQLGERV
jgi:hypothetical protein